MRRDHLLDGVKDVILDDGLSRNASRTSVVTAFSTSVAARSVRGLKLCFSRVEKILRFVDLNLLRNFGLGDFIGHD